MNEQLEKIKHLEYKLKTILEEINKLVYNHYRHYKSNDQSSQYTRYKGYK